MLLPTHNKGATLDAIITNKDLASLSNILPVDWSDHYLILFTMTKSITLPTFSSTLSKKSTRNLHLIPPDKLETAIKAHFSLPPLSDSTNDLTNHYNNSILETLDQIAPTTKNIPPKSWFNSELNNERRSLRHSEQIWRAHPSVDNLAILRTTRSQYKKHIFYVKASFLRSQLEQARNRPRELFKIVKKQTSTGPPKILASIYKCEEIGSFFTNKINMIELSFSSLPPLPQPSTILHTLPNSHNSPSTTSSAPLDTSVPLPAIPQQDIPPITNPTAKNNASWSDFSPVTESMITNIIVKLKPSAHSKDSLPPTLVQELKSIIAPIWTKIINSSVSTGCVPASLQLGQISPIPKNTAADPNDPNNLRPISNLPFLSKALEKSVLLQLEKHIASFNLLGVFQSGFRKGCSTETAMLNVIDDIHRSLDKGESSVLILLDLSAAFDTVHHPTLLSTLKDRFGLEGTVYKWFSSFLQNRSQQIKLSHFLSKPKPVSLGVPQGSILSPTLFNLFMEPLTLILKHSNINYHLYADDTQLYYKIKSHKDILHLNETLKKIQTWFHLIHLKLNPKKTEIIIFSPKNSCLPIQLWLNDIKALNCPFSTSNSVKSLASVLTRI
ncbi:uncharacterized protein LOC144766579 [Lissotriton helveticus]